MKAFREKYHSWLERRPERLELYKNLLILVVPIAVQNLLNSLVNSVDVLMLGSVGQDELSAVSLANQYMFILWGFFFGINSSSFSTFLCSVLFVLLIFNVEIS